VSSGTGANLPASVRARLKNRADELDLEFNQALQYYAMERFLYRLSRTGWSDRLILKGAAMLRVWDSAVARPTKDMDFLGRFDVSSDTIAAVVRDCLAVDSADGLEFATDFALTQITIEDHYPGARVVLSATLSGARIRLQLDIGVADAVVPDPGWVDYPVLLGMDCPRILAYQPATAVAEKFEAMVSKGGVARPDVGARRGLDRLRAAARTRPLSAPPAPAPPAHSGTGVPVAPPPARARYVR